MGRHQSNVTGGMLRKGNHGTDTHRGEILKDDSRRGASQKQTPVPH